ncbi:Uncharacterised protein [Cutibacterium granulosum]|uniref:Uncharacterized protein n=1 Tax=Cutibacterium granulosum TaxID=33011 RepID=A0A239W7K5_9ACTN|nr:Uncharacterised protein [Cutibacterium granulosum]
MSGAVCPHARVDQRVLAMNRRPARGQHHVTTWDSGRGQAVLNGDGGRHWAPSALLSFFLRAAFAVSKVSCTSRPSRRSRNWDR